MNSNLSNNLKRIRKDNNLSQEQLAEKLKVSRQAISKWESNQAYPEMDKIIMISNMFNISIDDLLNSNIREIKNEQESKNNINKYIDDFVKFIVNTINMFLSMNLKTKIKCIIEQLIIALILITIFIGIGYLINGILSSFNVFSSNNIYYFIRNIFFSIYAIGAVTLSLILMVHIFKIRYLNYYEKAKQDLNIDKRLDDKLIEQNKIKFNDKNEKIIIRDPKYSEYKFINGLLKCVVGFFKIASLMFSLFFCLSLIFSVIVLIFSFMIYKSGTFFVGILVICISCIVISIILLLTLLNFTFGRKNDKKKLILIFIGSIIGLSVGCGLAFIGFTKFNYTDKFVDKFYNDKQLVVEMSENISISGYNIEYIVEERDDIKITFLGNMYCDYNTIISGDDLIYISNSCNSFELFKELIELINVKQIPRYDIFNRQVMNIKVYASKQNIAKLKENSEKYYEMTNSRENLIQEYNEKIYSYEDKILNMENMLGEYKSKIHELQNQIDEYKSQILYLENQIYN